MKSQRLLNLGCGRHYHPAWINVDFNSESPAVTAHDLCKGLPFSDASFDALYHSHLLEHFSKDYAPLFLLECFRVLKPNGIIRVVVPDFEQIARIYLDLLEKSLSGNKQACARYDWITLELFDQMVRNKSGGAMLEYWKKNPMPAREFVIERAGSEVLDTLAVLRKQTREEDLPAGKPDFTSTEDPLKLGLFRLSGEVHQWMYDRYSLKVLLENAGFSDIRQCKADVSLISGFNGYNLDILADGKTRKPDSLFMEAIKAQEKATAA